MTVLPIETAAAPARSDAELLREFVQTNSEAAFSEIFSRHVDWVYSVALRQVSDRGLAEDVTQVVFTILARKAASLKSETVLSGWLFRVVRYTAIDAMRMEFRRRQREQSVATTVPDGDEPAWEEIVPYIDESLSKIRPADQRAILLRFYEQKSWRDVGAALGLNENAARVRVDRALEKLKAQLNRRGVASTVSALAALLLTNSVQSAPSTISLSRTSETVAALTHAMLRRWLIQKIMIGSLAACLLLCAVSFLTIPKSQNGPQQTLLGPDAFAALVEIDRAYWTGDAAQFLSRIHFRNAADENHRNVLRDFILAEGDFRRAAAKSYRDDQFGYSQTLNIILSGRNRPTHFGRDGDHAAGAFSRGRGIELIRVNGVWRWDFFNRFPPARLERIPEQTQRLRTLTKRITEGASATEILDEFRQK
ncbi:MAG TPA: RNA polymerase sigma factor [Verrucomicrobiae bacterium]